MHKLKELTETVEAKRKQYKDIQEEALALKNETAKLIECVYCGKVVSVTKETKYASVAGKKVRTIAVTSVFSNNGSIVEIAVCPYKLDGKLSGRMVNIPIRDIILDGERLVIE